MRVFFSFYIGTRKHGQRTAAWEARIPGLGFRYLGPAALAGLAAALAHPALVTWNVFLGLKTLFSLVKLKVPKSGVPIVQLMFLYEARASYRNISCTIGTPFWLDWDQEGSKPKESHQK